MIIRKAKTSEWEIIAGFQQKMAMETENLSLNMDVVGKGVQAVFNDPAKGQYYVAEKDNQIIATLMITFEWSDWRNSYMPWIQSLYVKQEFRKQGVYKEMYNYLQEKVRSDSEWPGIRLYVDRSNHAAQKVYSALGMNSDHYVLFEWMK
ncbi:GNAT family N-acetyltransferase [Bacteroidota bacterium]